MDMPDFSALTEALGGIDNIISVNCCFTRLRILLKEPARAAGVDFFRFSPCGARCRGSEVQLIFGMDAAEIARAMQQYLACEKA